MNNLKPRPTFQVLVMSEESRLGREAIETAYALKQLVQAGVRVFFYLEDRERTLDSPTDKIMLSLTACADEIEREKARQRVTDAMVARRAPDTSPAGVPSATTTSRSTTPPGLRRVDPPLDVKPLAGRRGAHLSARRRRHWSGADCEAAERGARAAPRPQQERPAGWARSSVHEVLFRELYRGEIVWNRTRKCDPR